MAFILITLSDTPDGGVSIHSDFKPAIGMPLSPAQSAALDIVARTGKQWGIADGAAAQVAASQSVAETLAQATDRMKKFNDALKSGKPMRGRLA
jgi:hypothetical protein